MHFPLERIVIGFPQKVEVLRFISCPGVLARELSMQDSSHDEEVIVLPLWIQLSGDLFLQYHLP